MSSEYTREEVLFEGLKERAEAGEEFFILSPALDEVISKSNLIIDERNDKIPEVFGVVIYLLADCLDQVGEDDDYDVIKRDMLEFVDSLFTFHKGIMN